MTHRTSVVSLDIDSDYAEVLEVAVHENILVFRSTKTTSIISLEFSASKICFIMPPKAFPPFSLRHDPPALHCSGIQTIDALFREMQRDRAQMAVVIDEYGGTAGIVTVEDLLEEIG